jgi:hypothetical protein
MDWQCSDYTQSKALPSTHRNRAIAKLGAAPLDEQSHRLPGNEYGVALVDRIAQQDATTHETEVPKGGGHENASLPFAVKPLHDKPHAEKGLSDEAYDQQ